MSARHFLRRVRSGVAVLDGSPNAFAFTPITGADVSSEYLGDPVALTGMTTAGTFSVANGSLVVNGEDRGSSGIVPPNATIQAKLTSSADYQTLVRATVVIGGVSADFDVTTKAAPTPTPTPTYLWQTYSQPAPTQYPAATGVIRPTVGNKTDLYSAIAAASAGDVIPIAPGIYTDGWDAPARNMAGGLIHLRAADPANPPVFKGRRINLAPGTGTYVRAAFIRGGWNGLAFENINFELTDAIEGDVDFFRVVELQSGAQNIWLVNCQVSGTALTGNKLGRNIFAQGVTGLRVVGGKTQNAKYGINHVNCNNVEIVGHVFEKIAADASQRNGPQGELFYFNAFQKIESASGDHSDFYQIFTVDNANHYRKSLNLSLIGNFADCDASTPIRNPSDPNSAGFGRCQGILIQNEKNDPNLAVENCMVAANQLWGTEYAGIAFYSRADLNILIRDNLIIHVDGPDTISYSALRIGKTTDVGSITGEITGNVVSRLDTSAGAPGMTGQIGTVLLDPAQTRTATDQAAAKAAWLPERDRHLAYVLALQ